jgi:septum formation protein
MRLILASASPRRAELLRAAGFVFETVATNVDESITPGETPAVYVRRLAAEKSAAGLKSCATTEGRHPRTEQQQRQKVAQDFSPADSVVLGADTTVVVDGEVLGKPRDDSESAAMLRRLAGRRHEVLTGISLRLGAFEVGRVETTAVAFAALGDAEVAWYVKSGEGRDKAGAYAIQGLASRFVTTIDGSYSNVVGLPVAAVVELLRDIGFFRTGW